MLIKIHEKQSRRKIEEKREGKESESKVRRGSGNERLPFVFNYSCGHSRLSAPQDSRKAFKCESFIFLSDLFSWNVPENESTDVAQA